MKQNFLKLLCLLQHSRIDLSLSTSQAIVLNSDPAFTFIPFWHDRLENNTANAAIARNNRRQGRVRGQAFGISDPLGNHVSEVGARFTFNFIIDPSQVTAGALHRFMVEMRTDGVFEHFAAVPFSGDNRQPAAQTLSSGRTEIDIMEIDFSGQFPTIQDVSDGGIVLRINNNFFDSQDGSHTDRSETVVPNNNSIRVITNGRVHLGMKFRPSGLRPIRVRVRRSISAQAIGVFSDIQIRGNNVASMTSEVLQSYFQKTVEAGDPCFTVLNS